MNENQSQNLNNNISNDYKRYMKKPDAKTISTKIGEICGIIAIILFISGIILAFTDIVMPGVCTMLVSFIPFFVWLIYASQINLPPDEANIFVKKNNQMYYINNQMISSNEDFAAYIKADAIGAPKGLSILLAFSGYLQRKKKVKSFCEMLNEKSFDDPYFINPTSHIKSVEIIKETPSYLKINARFENQGRKQITIYNVYEDYNELITEIKNMEVNNENRIR